MSNLVSTDATLLNVQVVENDTVNDINVEVTDPKDLKSDSPSDSTDSSRDSDSMHRLKGSLDKTVPLWIILVATGPKFACGLAWSAQWAALSPYLESLLPSWAVQVTQFIGPLTGLIIGPSLGMISDATTHKWGRRRPYLVYGMIATIPCWIIMGFTKEIGQPLGDTETNRTWTAVFTILTYLWMDITVNIVATPAQLLLADMSGNRQFLGATLGQAMAVFGNVLLSLWFIFLGNPARNLLAFLLTLSGIMIFTVTLAFFVCKEERFVPTKAISTKKLIVKSFSSIYVGIKTMPKQLLILCCAMGLWSYGGMSYGAAKSQFFGLVVMNGTSSGADTCGHTGHPDCTPSQDAYNQGVSLAGGLTDLISNVLGFLILFTVPFTVRKIGAKWTLLAWTSFQTLLIVMAFVHNQWVDVVMAILVSFAGAVLWALIFPFIVHIVNDADKNGLYFGALNVFNVAGQFLNFALAAVLVSTSMGYALPVLIGGILAVIAWIIVAIFFKVQLKAL